MKLRSLAAEARRPRKFLRVGTVDASWCAVSIDNIANTVYHSVFLTVCSTVVFGICSKRNMQNLDKYGSWSHDSRVYICLQKSYDTTILVQHGSAGFHGFWGQYHTSTNSRMTTRMQPSGLILRVIPCYTTIDHRPPSIIYIYIYIYDIYIYIYMYIIYAGIGDYQNPLGEPPLTNYYI